MARLHPSLPPRDVTAITAGARAERDVLQRLEEDLPAAYTLFHSVDYTDAHGAAVHHGELDIVIVNQAGDVMQLEVKSGPVTFSERGIHKTYGAAQPRVKDVSAQLGSQYGAMRSRLSAAGLPVRLAQLLVLTDARAIGQTVRWPRERIVDSTELPDLPARVQGELGPGLPDTDRHRAVLDFFSNVFKVQPDVSALAGRLLEASSRLSSGLATWVPRMQVPGGVVRVVGTAGSGKTQLALRLLREAAGRRQRAAYFCFNRALADHMARVAPVQCEAETFHQHADHLCRRAGLALDYAAEGVFDTMAEHAGRILAGREPDLDLLVIDEMQDMQPAWVQVLAQRLRPQGRMFLLEDPSQLLYGNREPFSVAGEVVITSSENFRSPRSIVQLCNLLGLTPEPVEALGPHEGEVPDPIVYGGAGQPRLETATRQAVQRCLDAGHAIEDIALVTLRGRASSQILALQTLGPWTLRRFTGGYDEAGSPRWSEGQLLADTVYRFKGQAAHAVVLTECDFAQWDDKACRLLFVGLTRARMRVEWVVSEQVAGLLQHRLRA